jgi:hypothetical protein
MNINSNCYQTIWDICKCEIRKKSIEYAKTKSRERQNRLSVLEKRLQYLYHSDGLKNNQNITTEILKLEQEIEEIATFPVVSFILIFKVTFIC